MNWVDYWKFFGGLGIFIFGMNYLERVLKQYSGRSLKIFLKKNTQNIFKAIAGGAIVTGIVQSSSVVSLLVLAFVEAGIFGLSNAIGVILGTNIGTTLDSWIIATLGFKYSISDYIYPIIAISAIGMFVSSKRKKIQNILTVFFSIGIIFMGLAMMKESAMLLVSQIDFKHFLNFGIYIFIIIGFVITLIIQSSSATIAIALTAIYAGVLSFNLAAAVVIGSEVGTTIKILFWGMTGSIEKKRVAIGNFIFNLFTSIIAVIVLNYLINSILQILSIRDPLISLVFFQTFINLISVLIFLPFISIFKNWLVRFIKDNKNNANTYLNSKMPLEPVLAVFYFKLESENLFRKTLNFIGKIFKKQENSSGILGEIKLLTYPDFNIEDDYQKLKQSEGNLLNYYLKIKGFNLTNEESEALLQYIKAVRKLIYASKAAKDISHNIHEFSASVNDFLHKQCSLIESEWIEFENKLISFHQKEFSQNLKTEIENLEKKSIEHQNLQKNEVINLLKSNILNELEASTLMNVQREILSCKKSLLNSLLILNSSSNNLS